MADNNLETMLRNQLQANLIFKLDSATQAGDIVAARRAAQELSEFAIQHKPTDTPQFTNADIRAALKAKAPWFGVDPRRSARAVEFGKNMEPESFKSADEFATQLIKAVDDEYDRETEEELEEMLDEEEEEEKKVARKRTDAPSGEARRVIPRRTSGPWMKLSDAPKEIAAQIKASSDKFTRNVSKEQREKYIVTALNTAYAADQRAKGKK
jgi:hypothetical protein